MKKNLLSILILALLIVNIVLTAIMMFSVTNASNKTAALVTDIASIIKLDIGEVASGVETVEKVPMEDTKPYNFAEKMMIPLQKGADDKDHYIMVSVTLSMNTKAKGYKEYGETIAEKETLIQSAITEVFNTYTIEEVKEDQTKIREEIVKKLQTMYDSKFIYDVSFGEVLYQ